MALKKKRARNYLFRRLTIYICHQVIAHPTLLIITYLRLLTKERARACSESLKKTQICGFSWLCDFCECLCAMKIINLRLIAAKKSCDLSVDKKLFFNFLFTSKARELLRKIEKFKDHNNMILTCENCLFN